MSDSFRYDPPREPWLNILYKDRDIMVVDKPSGLLSVPGRIHSDSILERVRASCNAYAVHRLDMDTSGLLLIALRRKAERNLQEQFRKRMVKKRYVALVVGSMSLDSGEIRAPLSRCSGTPPRSIVDFENGREAMTGYKVLQRLESRTRVMLFPKTGRSHQLRVHLCSLGHPIVGDRFYGQHGLVQKERLMLHAAYLSFLHPYHQKRQEFSIPAPF